MERPIRANCDASWDGDTGLDVSSTGVEFLTDFQRFGTVWNMCSVNAEERPVRVVRKCRVPCRNPCSSHPYFLKQARPVGLVKLGRHQQSA